MKCVQTYDGMQIWITDDKATKLQSVLQMGNPPKMVTLGDNKIALNNISGIYDELDMREKDFLKKGMFKCLYMRWHDFKDNCNCKENYRLYGFFGTAYRSKQLEEYEKTHGKLEKNLDNNLIPIMHDIKTIGLKTHNIAKF